ncbi:MAG: Holliday junction branch migration DNA helicase RuvB [Candidatus Spechtbacteria bacterium]|nr:Holliday junction branch migration DNA helicase RuvB [Candidatus Spechtbacteria bacterium]
MSDDPLLSKNHLSEDVTLDLALRPHSWDDYIGQTNTKNNLRVFIEAAKKRSDPLDHVLIYGPPGLGKTTLAHLIARELGTSIKLTSGPAIERVGDLASILTNLTPGEVLFIDEAHRLNKTIEEVLYPAMENRTLDIILGKGPSARTIQLELPPFTLIAATTRIGLLSSPLRSRFGITLHVEYYSHEDIGQILTRSARMLGIQSRGNALPLIARSSRSTPRVANRLIKRVRDYADVRGEGIITPEIVKHSLNMLEVDELGLETTDRRILEIIINKFRGGPVGISTLAAGTSEEEDTIEEVYEPYLLQLGFIERTPRGRIATPLAYQHLGIDPVRNNSAETLQTRVSNANETSNEVDITNQNQQNLF